MPQHHDRQLKLLQTMLHKKDSSLSGTSSEYGSGGVHAGTKSVNKHHKETLSNKPQHQSKLAEAVTGQDSIATPSAELIGSSLFKRCSSISEYQSMSAEYDDSLKTDSGIEVLFSVP